MGRFTTMASLDLADRLWQLSRAEECWPAQSDLLMHTYPYMPYPDLSTPIPSHLNHSRAPNAKPKPSDPLAPQQRTPEHSDSLASSQRIPDPTHLRPFLSLVSSRFPISTLIPDPTSFDLHSFASSLFPTFHRSRDCSWAKPNRVPPSLDAS